MSDNEHVVMPPDLYRSGYRLWNLYADGQGRRWRWMIKRGYTNVAFGPAVATPEEAIAGMRIDKAQRKAGTADDSAGTAPAPRRPANVASAQLSLFSLEPTP